MLTKMFEKVTIVQGSKFFFSSEIMGDYSPLKIQLIKTSLPFVHKYGWSANAIHAACAKMDLSPAAHKLIQPYDLIVYSMKRWNKSALRKIDDTNFQGNKRIRDKIHYAIKTRLTEQLEYIDTWNQAMGIGAHPQNISTTKNLLWGFSDEVWRRCGDTSTDYNYYTKRILFNTAYATTQLHLLTDQSTGKNESWKFLQRRLDDIMVVGKGINDLKTVSGAALDGVLNLFTMFREPPASQIKNPIKQQKLSQIERETLNEQQSVQRQA